MDWPRLLPGELKAVQEPQHPTLLVAYPETLFDQATQVAGAPGDAAVALEIRASENEGLERGLLTFAQAAVPTGARPIAQASHALGVVAVHPVGEGLAGHAREPGRLLARDIFQCVGERHETGADTTVPLVAGQAAQLGRAPVAANWQGCWHRDRSRSGRQKTSRRQKRIRQNLMGLVLVREGLFRSFANRKQVAAYAGLTPMPFASGERHREQGISKAGNPLLRKAMVELAWLWLRYQPDSTLARWFTERVGSARGRIRKITAIALARKLLVALWRYLTAGLMPEGAHLKAA